MRLFRRAWWRFGWLREAWWTLRPPRSRQWATQICLSDKAQRAGIRDRALAMARESIVRKALDKGYMPGRFEADEYFDKPHSVTITVTCDCAYVGRKTVRTLGNSAFTRELLAESGASA